MPNHITEHVQLAPLTTLGAGGSAHFYAVVDTVESLMQVVEWARKQHKEILVLGGGSNILIPDEGFDGVVIHMNTTDIVVDESEECTDYHVGAGVVFDDFVAETVSSQHWGLENLSGIPGSVGATPIQNVGAYGTEVASHITYVEVFNIETGKTEALSNEACQFGYRDSVFKKPAGKKYIVTKVGFRLKQCASADLTYKDLSSHFDEHITPDPQEVRDAVLSIRSKKFPDWNTEGTAGSFFKNPIITHDEFVFLKEKFPEVPGYEMSDGRVKISLGWILDKACNLKGYTNGDVRLFENQALVLVCKKGTSTQEIEMFADEVAQKVFDKTNLCIEREVTTIKK